MAHSSLILESLDDFAARMKSKSKSNSGLSTGNCYPGHMFPCPRRLLYRIALGLGWRSQLPHEPTVAFSRFHWIDQLGRSLMVVIALGTLECPDIKAGWAGVHTCQHGCSLALWPRRPAKRDHDALLKPGGSATLSVTGRCRYRAVMESPWTRQPIRRCSILLTFQNGPMDNTEPPNQAKP